MTCWWRGAPRGHAVGDVRVRVASGERELRDVGALTAEAYHADRLLRPEDDYTVELRDAGARAREAVLLVALVPSTPEPGAGGESTADPDPGTGADPGVVVGTVTLAPHGTSYAEVAEPGEVEIRMLAVAPEARGRGVAEALMRSALEHAVTSGYRRVVLSTFDVMQTAQRLYRRLHFRPEPARDWQHEGVHVRVHVWDAPAAPGAAVETATWRPVDVLDVGPWRLGLSGGFTRRANSVVALGEPDDVDAAIAAVEERYAAAGQPAVFRVCSGSRPADLGDRLAARGYTTASRTSVLVRALDGSAPDGSGPGDADENGSGPDPSLRFTSADEPDDAWLRGWLAVKSEGVDLDLARRVVAGAPARYLTASDEVGVVGVIRAARSGDWVGLSCLMVPGRARRRGVGRALTELSLRDAAERGATHAFLQVEEHNTGARRLYVGAGFEVADVYEYRERASGVAAVHGGC